MEWGIKFSQVKRYVEWFSPAGAEAIDGTRVANNIMADIEHTGAYNMLDLSHSDSDKDYSELVGRVWYIEVPTTQLVRDISHLKRLTSYEAKAMAEVLVKRLEEREGNWIEEYDLFTLLNGWYVEKRNPEVYKASPDTLGTVRAINHPWLYVVKKRRG